MDFAVPTLLWLELRPVRTQLWTALGPHAGIHLSYVRWQVVGLLVRGVWSRQGGLGSSLRMGQSVRGRLQGCIPSDLWGSS